MKTYYFGDNPADEGSQGCEHPFDALQHASGLWLHVVDGGRTVTRDATGLLNRFARWCAYRISSADTPLAVLEYIASDTPTATLRIMARNAARLAAASWSWNMAESTARHAALVATNIIDPRAAWRAAWYAAEAESFGKVGGLAWDEARDAQRQKFTEMVEAALASEKEKI